MLTLYYPPAEWAALAEDRRKVLAFFKEFETIRTADGGTYLATTLDDKFLPIAILDKQPHQSTYVTRDVDVHVVASVPCDEAELVRLTYVPFWSVLLMREDLLWIITMGSNRAKSALAQLWDKFHVRDLHGRKFQDSVSDRILKQTCTSSRTRIAEGAKWIAGVMVELVFSFDDEEQVRALLWEIEQGMDTSFVVQYDPAGDDDSDAEDDDDVHDDVLGIGKRMVNGDVEIISRFVPQDNGDLLVVHDDNNSAVIDEHQVSAMTETFNRGMNFTTTQAAVLAGVANTSTCNALASLVSHCTPETVNMTELVVAARRDKQELQWYLVARKREHVDTDSHATLTT